MWSHFFTAAKMFLCSSIVACVDIDMDKNKKKLLGVEKQLLPATYTPAFYSSGLITKATCEYKS